jgi:hypothetical protein
VLSIHLKIFIYWDLFFVWEDFEEVAVNWDFVFMNSGIFDDPVP